MYIAEAYSLFVMLADVSKNTIDKGSPGFWAWFAGLIDGEGSLQITRFKNAYETRFKRKHNYSARLTLAMNEPVWVPALHKALGYGSLYERKTPTGATCCQLVISATQLRDLLPKIRPYLVVKQDQLEILVEALTLLKPGRKQLGSLLQIKTLYRQLRELHGTWDETLNRHEAQTTLSW